jgi:hypothetical protein
MQNLGYVVVTYYGNTAATATTITSSNLANGSYTSPDLSLNTLYTFTLTPYSTAGSTGNVKTLYVDTSPSIAGVYVGNSTSSSVQLQWYGSYSYVAISQSVNGGAYVDLSAVVVSTPYTVSDVSGNTALSYKVTPYYSGTEIGAASAIAVTTNVQAPSNLNVNWMDSSGAIIRFTVPKNTYNSAVYTVYTTDASASGTSSPLLLTGLTANTNYNIYGNVVLDGTKTVAMTGNVMITTSPIPMYYFKFNNDIQNYASGTGVDVSGIVFYNTAGTATTPGYSSIHPAALTDNTGSIYFGGSSSYLNLPSLTITNTGCCLSMWIYPTNRSQNNGIYVASIFKTAFNNELDFAYNINNYYFIGYIVWTSNTKTWGEYPTPAINTWSYITYNITYDAVDNYLNKYDVYINGVIVSSNSVINQTKLPITQNPYNFYIGRAGDGKPYQGYMSSLKYFNTPLSASQIATLYASTS